MDELIVVLPVVLILHVVAVRKFSAVLEADDLTRGRVRTGCEGRYIG